MIAALIPWDLLAWAAAGIGALAAMWFGGRKAAKTDAKLKAQRADDKRNERMNDVQSHIGATDAERTKRLHDYIDQHDL